MKRLLYISHRVPYPPDKGERVRAFHEIKALSEHFRVTLAFLAHDAADQQAAEPMRQWCEEIIVAPAGGLAGKLRGGLSLLRGRSATEGYFQSKRLMALLKDAAGREPFDVAIGYSSSTLPYLLAVPARRRIMDLIDVDSLKWASYAESSGWPKSWLYRAEARAVARLEEEAIQQCDAVVLVSEAEVDALHKQLQTLPKRATSPADDGNAPPATNVFAVGCGVDADYFHPPEESYDGPPTLVFTGQMDYRPNVEGVCWFVKEVWPLLRQDFPDLRFNIVGRNPAPAVRDLGRIPGITITGTVPDVRPYLAAATLAIIPLIIARGVQNKALEAMAMALPIVASPSVLKGLGANASAAAQGATTPGEWKSVIRELLSDKERRQTLAVRCHRLVLENCTWDRQLGKLVRLCRQTSITGQLADIDRRREGLSAAPPPSIHCVRTST